MTAYESAGPKAVERYLAVGFELLSEPEKVVAALWVLEGDVNNGGFDQYFWNSSGDLAFYAPNALRAIGALHTAEIVSEANSVFGDGGPPRERERRQDVLDALSDEARDQLEELDAKFYAYPDDIAGLASVYLDGLGAS